MSWEYSPRLLPLLLTVSLASLAAWTLWPLRRAPGARTLFVMLLSAAVWAGTEYIQYGLQELAAKVAWETLVYIWIGLTTVLWFVFCLQYTGVRGRLRVSEFLSLLAIPVISVILAALFPTDGPMRHDVSLGIGAGGVLHVSKTFGVMFWVFAAYLDVLMLIGTVLLLRTSLHSGRPYSVRARALIIAALCPWIANVAYLATGYRYFAVDPTPVAIGISGALLVWAVRSMSLFELSPAGREAAIEAMRDGWLVVDTADRIVDLNPAARGILGRGDLTGRRMSILAPMLSPMLRAHMNAEAVQAPVTIGRHGSERLFHVEISPLSDRYGWPAGHVLTLRDDTRRTAAQQEREALIAGLQQALADVRQLSGLLPICADCKKIRDDQGYWTQLEHYLRHHTDATFTHGLCPDCERRLEEQATNLAIKSGRVSPPTDASNSIAVEGCADVPPSPPVADPPDEHSSVG